MCLCVPLPVCLPVRLSICPCMYVLHAAIVLWHVCMYGAMCICIYIYLYIYIYIHFLYIYTPTHAHTHTHEYIHTHTNTHIHTYVRAETKGAISEREARGFFSQIMSGVDFFHRYVCMYVYAYVHASLCV